MANDSNNKLYVKSDTPCSKLASSLYAKYKEGVEDLSMQAVGASAVNQAVKAVIIFNKNLINNGSLEMAYVIPRFVKIDKGRDGVVDEINVVELNLKLQKIY